MARSKTTLVVDDANVNLRIKEVTVYIYLTKVFGASIIYSELGRTLLLNLGEQLILSSTQYGKSQGLEEGVDEFLTEFKLLDGIPSKEEKAIAFMAFGASRTQTYKGLNIGHKIVSRALENLEMVDPLLEDNLFIDVIYEWITSVKDSEIFFKEYKNT